MRDPHPSARRRPSGQGSVFRRGNGRWAGMLDLGWIDGRRRRATVAGGTQREVLAKLDKLRRDRNASVNLVTPRRTLGDWLDEWIQEVKSFDGTRPTTLARYRSIIGTHLKPTLGNHRLDHLSAQDVHGLLTSLRGDRSPATIVKVHSVLRAALSDAERFDLVQRNVAKAVRPPSLGRRERPVLTPQQAHHMLAVASGDRLEGLIVVALGTGLRRGELLGLRWSDVDVQSGALWVRQTVQRSEGKLRFDEPKTYRSRRPLPLPRFVTAALHEQRSRQAVDRAAAGREWQDYGLVFTSATGTPLEPRNVTRRFGVLRDEANLPWLRLHDLRHACATFLLAEGVDPRSVMELLGHSTIRLTMDTYGHALPERLRAAAAAMDLILERESEL